MADDRLRMSAEVVDKFSAPLANLAKMLKGIAADQDKQGRERRRLSDEQTAQLRGLAQQLRDVVQPAFNAVGLSALSVSGAVAALSAAGKGFAGNVRELQLVSGATGVSIEKLRELEYVARNLNIAPEGVRNDMMQFTGIMTQLRKNSGETANWITAQAPPIKALAEAMKRSRTDIEAFQVLIDRTRQLFAGRPPSEAQTLLRQFGLHGEWAQLGTDVEHAMSDAGRHIDAFTKQGIKNADAFNKAWIEFGQTLDNVKNSIGADVLPAMTALAKKAGETIEALKSLKRENIPGTFHGPQGGVFTPEQRPKTPFQLMPLQPGGWPGQMIPGSGGRMLTPGTMPQQQLDDTKKAIQQGAKEGVVQGLQEALGLNDAGGAAATFGERFGTWPGGGSRMIGARPGFGGFRPRGGTGGAAGGPGLDTGGANYMRGDLPGAGDLTTVDTAAGRITVNRAAADDVKGFIDDMVAAGAPVESVGSYNRRMIAGTDKWSQHAYGTAIDYGQRSRNVVSPQFKAWADANADKLREIAKARHMRSGGDWRNPDFGHFEWSGLKARPEAADAAKAVRGSMFNDATTASGVSAAVREGIALPSGGKMGDQYKITTPDGREFVAPLIDRGPASWTGRGVDVSAPLARRMGYGRDFPTDSRFKVEPFAGDLMRADAERQAKVMSEAKVSGGASLQIDMRGVPKGTRSRLESWGIFDDVRLNQGTQMRRTDD